MEDRCRCHPKYLKFRVIVHCTKREKLKKVGIRFRLGYVGLPEFLLFITSRPKICVHLADKIVRISSEVFSFLFFSFCAVPYNHTALLVVGGYTKKGAIASVELLDTKTGRWEKLQVRNPLLKSCPQQCWWVPPSWPSQDLPKPRYGHSCLMMELAGRPGVLVSGGALTGDEVDFYDLVKKRWGWLARTWAYS